MQAVVSVAFVKCTGDSDYVVRRDGCEACGKLIEKMQEAVSVAFGKHLGDADRNVRRDACMAYDKHPGELRKIHAVAVGEGLGDSDCLVRRDACEAYGKLAEDMHKTHSAAFAKRPGDSYYGVRMHERFTTSSRRDAKSCFGCFRQTPWSLGDSDLDVRRDGCEAYSKLSEEIQKTHSVALDELRGDSDVNVMSCISRCGAGALKHLCYKVARTDLSTWALLGHRDSLERQFFSKRYPIKLPPGHVVLVIKSFSPFKVFFR